MQTPEDYELFHKKYVGNIVEYDKCKLVRDDKENLIVYNFNNNHVKFLVLEVVGENRYYESNISYFSLVLKCLSSEREFPGCSEHLYKMTAGLESRIINLGE